MKLGPIRRFVVRPPVVALRWVLGRPWNVQLRAAIRWRAEHDRMLRLDPSLVAHRGALMHALQTRLPRDATNANAELVVSVLDELSVPYTVVRNGARIRLTVASSDEHRSRIVQGLDERHRDRAIYASVLLRTATAPRPGLVARIAGLAPSRMQPLSRIVRDGNHVRVVRIWRWYLHPGSGLVYGSIYGCDLEFWSRSHTAPTKWIAPRTNVASPVLSDADVALAPRAYHRGGRSPSVFDRRMVDDVAFPVDVVYTWVDDSDPRWRQKFKRWSGHAPGSHHRQASSQERFRSRDELRYSLRSIDMYAPWVRHIYVVTDDQDPGFIDFDEGKITLVDHREIAHDPDALPVFNSNAIISWLHRIPGLSEHYVYLNDDVFFGRDTSPALLFTPSGLSKVFPSNTRRPFGDPSPADEPHLNISRNIRTLLERDFGRTLSRAVKHTPHAQRVSVQEEMEKRYPDIYARTSRSRFRHHDDIAADQLFHYYAQITGRAITSQVRYSYVNIGDRAAEPSLARLLDGRRCDVFCLNDAPDHGSEPMSDVTVRSFLEAYFPIPSTFERS